MDVIKLLDAFKNTLLMTLISASLAYIVGLPLGVLLYVTGKNGLIKNSQLIPVAQNNDGYPERYQLVIFYTEKE
jgi:ABC-type methionine transport system permease subunit